jgi:hypothetical protein
MAIKANIVIDQGTTFQTTINVTDENDEIVNLTGYTGAAQLRKHFTSTTSYAFTVSISPTIGTVTLSMSANATANVVGGRYVYDCELTDTNGAVTRLIEGIATVTPQVTR